MLHEKENIKFDFVIHWIRLGYSISPDSVQLFLLFPPRLNKPDRDGPSGQGVYGTE